MPHIDLELQNGVPIFVASADDPSFIRVHGGVYDRKKERWVFPAYPPFGERALADLKKVAPGFEFRPAVTAHADYLKKVPALVEARTLPAAFSFVTKPFEHQIEGLSYLLHYPRFGLLWDMGTGKSKVIVDLKRARPGSRMLIVTPTVTVQNWVREFEIHAAGEGIRVVGLLGTPKQKRKILENYRDFDVIVASYGTVRTMGVPRLHKKALAAIKTVKRGGVPISSSGARDLVRAVRVFSEAEDQVRYIEKWAQGTPLTQIAREAAAEAKEKPRWIEDIEYSTIVADESHNMKQPSSQQTKVCRSLAAKAPYRVIMSGTPTLGNPTHLFAQMKFLSPAIFPEDTLQFADKFLVTSKWDRRLVTGYKNMNIINARVQRVTTQKTKDVCLDLPPRQIIDVPFKLSGEQTKLYNTLVNTMGVDLAAFFEGQETSSLEMQNAATRLNKLAQISSGFLIDSQKNDTICNQCPHLARCVSSAIQPYTPACVVAPVAPPSKLLTLKTNPKLEALDDLLDSIAQEPRNKVIIWGVYRAELDAITALLDGRKLDYVRVDGSTRDVQSNVDRFNTNPSCRVYVGQIATGIGITLNAATYTIYYSLDWSLGSYLQSIDRNYRAGQEHKVTVYRLLGEGTVDEYKAVALDEKKDISATLTNKISCATCEKRIVCLKAGIELFDPGCIHKRTATRTIARAKTI